MFYFFIKHTKGNQTRPSMMFSQEINVWGLHGAKILEEMKIDSNLPFFILCLFKKNSIVYYLQSISISRDGKDFKTFNQRQPVISSS